jgi:hypothetical protein
MSKSKQQWTGHVDEAPHGVPAKFERKLTEQEQVVNALAKQEGITTAAAAEKLRHDEEKAKLSAEDTMKDVSAAILPAESSTPADRP